jgi:hypothetical protein
MGSLSQINADQSQTMAQLIVDADYTGWVKYIFFFDSAIDAEVVKDFANKIELFKPPSKKDASEVTTDNRICKSQCTREPIPSGSSSSSSHKNDELNGSVKIEKEAIIETDKTCFNIGSEFLQCKLNMNDMSMMADKFPDFVEHQS